MINEYDIKELRSNNFEAHHRAMENLSIVNIIEVVDYVNELSTFIPSNNEILDYLDDIIAPFVDIIDELRTEVMCPKCGHYLFKSDFPQYKYVCAKCDENF